jgi:tetratricopeptide (TPR) repeat protein
MNYNRLSALFLFLFLLGTGGAKADTAREQAAGFFDQGNADYQKGNYESAESRYRQILDLGIDSGSIYYNLGNACFKQKKLGEAVYFWEKAQQKLPSDREIKENLELARLLLVDRIEVPPNPLPVQLLTRAAELLTIEQEALLVLALFLVTNILLSLYLFKKNSSRAFRALLACFCAGILFLIFTCSLSWKIYERDFRKNGVVIEQRVDVRSGPGKENITVFTIHEGIKVRVHGSTNGWYQISLPNGWNGWLPQDDIRIL